MPLLFLININNLVARQYECSSSHTPHLACIAMEKRPSDMMLAVLAAVLATSSAALVTTDPVMTDPLIVDDCKGRQNLTGSILQQLSHLALSYCRNYPAVQSKIRRHREMCLLFLEGAGLQTFERCRRAILGRARCKRSAIAAYD